MLSRNHLFNYYSTINFPDFKQLISGKTISLQNTFKLKKLALKIHLWLGLSVGVIIFIVAITGCIYAFQSEIQDLTQPFRFVEAQNSPLLSPSKLKEIAEKALPNKAVHSVTYAQKNRAAVLAFYKEGADYYFLMYINPYTGAVQKVKNMDKDFFRFILNGHFYLWLPDEIGHVVVASSTLIFVVLVVTGIFLWFPKNKAAINQRFKIKWNASWRRKNFDLHSVFGFYTAFIALIFAITGLVWGFEWFAKTYYFTLSGGKSMVEYSETFNISTEKDSKLSAPATDILWQKTIAETSNLETIEVHYPDSRETAIGISTNSDATTYWKMDHRYYNQYTLKELEVNHLYGKFTQQLSKADLLMRMNYDIHTGAIFGFTGKLIAFFISLIIATLPITGFLLWYGRHFKKKQVKI